MNCRMCGSTKLHKFLDLGFTPPADQFRRKDQSREPDVYYPLQVMMCDDCGLAQLSHVVSPEVLYRNDYPYESSTTRTGQAHWSEFAASVVERLKLGPQDLAVDIGSNVGVLLGAFRSQGLRVQGVDPAANIVMIAQANGIDTICDFFNEDTARTIVAEKGHASVVTATNVFAHVDDLDRFISSVKELLSEKGVFIFEAPYFVNLLKHNEYDTIYHEHLSYLSVKPLLSFFRKHGMEIFHIEERDIHGGSFRVHVGRIGMWPASPDAERMAQEEVDMGIYSHDKLAEFAAAVRRNKDELTWLLHSLKHQGKRIAAVSAPAKGMTLLNYCGLDADILDFVTEKSKLKIGRYTPGAHIPVVSDEELLNRQPDYALLLAWNFAEEIIGNLHEFRRRGGKFIIPIPFPKIVD
ncbi:class I SAM-dependent methyltransferase [Rhizobium lentis]|nr:class I SAM-dependent methyltransferase [Rhizobium lentis]MBX5096495.1 class I SAM-dependent methyltransferase [Rhizobium lentis]MBX5122043.1 class I SAM-dependent methyltransferase [Rhizobium lentis]MBX5127774.1 class I SAM-dependent methyltransferase [Rhizobium lentis]